MRNKAYVQNTCELIVYTNERRCVLQRGLAKALGAKGIGVKTCCKIEKESVNIGRAMSGEEAMELADAERDYSSAD